jgi:DNA-binding transcriptional ArsR family regulator
MSGDTLSITLGALADPTRRAILARLAEGEASAGELAAPFDMTPQAVSRHLKVLEHAKLISRSRTAQWRPCKLEPLQLREVDNWLEGYRRFWEGSFDKMENYLHELTKGHPDNARN